MFKTLGHLDTLVSVINVKNIDIFLSIAKTSTYSHLRIFKAGKCKTGKIRKSEQRSEVA